MGIAINIILLGISFIAFAVSGGYITNSSVRITGIPGYKEIPDLESAHKWASIAAVVTWISIALMIVGIILYIVFASETAEFTAKWVIYGLLFLTLVGTITVGILSALTANDVNKSKVPDKNLADRQAIIAAVLAIVVFVLVVVVLILTFVHKSKKKETSLGFLGGDLGRGELGGLSGGEIPSWLSDDPELLSDL
jgi:hypothetical protein